MLKVLNHNPHFMRDSVPVADYAEAWDVICSMQRKLGQGILLVGSQTWVDLSLAECFPDFVWEEGVKAVYINSDKNQGISAARNKAVKSASGEYFLSL